MQNEILSIETLTQSAIAHANKRGDTKEGPIGKMLGAWKNGRLGDCAMRNAAESELSKSQSNAARETVQFNRFIVSNSGAGFCAIDTQTSRFSAFYQGRGDAEEIARQANAQPNDTAFVHWEHGATVNVEITFKDGEVIIEKKVNEVHNHEETLFLRRFGMPGLSFDQCDIASLKII